MHIRINDVTVSPSRIDELGDVLTNKTLPVVQTQNGFRGLLCAADRTTGNCNVVSIWDTKESLDASEKAVTSLRSETVDAVGAKLNSVSISEILREVRVKPSQVGSRVRVVRLTAPAGSTDKIVDFYDTEAVPRLESQGGFLNARLVRDIAQDGRFAAVSHWSDTAALEASDKISAALRDQIASALGGTEVESVSTFEVVQIDLAT